MSSNALELLQRAKPLIYRQKCCLRHYVRFQCFVKPLISDSIDFSSFVKEKVMAQFHFISNTGLDGPVEAEVIEGDLYKIVDDCRLMIGDDDYQYNETPGLGDIIRAEINTDGQLVFKELVKPAVLKSTDFILCQETAESVELQNILNRLHADEGFWERCCVGLLIIHVPPSLSWDPVSEICALENQKIKEIREKKRANNRTPNSELFIPESRNE